MGISGELMKKLLFHLRPYMRNEIERSACLMTALGTDACVLYRLVYNTHADVFIPHMVNELITFGEISPGEPALIALLKVIREGVGEDVKTSIDELLEEIKFNLKKSPSANKDDVDKENPPSTNKDDVDKENPSLTNKDDVDKEKPNLFTYTSIHNLDIYILNLAIQAAKAVVHVRIGKGYMGTGFMIAPDLLMTTNHIIYSQEVARQAECTFNYQLDINRKESNTHTAQALPGIIFHTNEKLDYTVICIKDVPDFYSPLRLIYSPLKLKDKLVNRGDNLTIIQHLGGSVKKISMQNTFVEYADNTVVQYTKTTLPGSAGSPVLNNEFEVIAIHHSGGLLAEPNTDKRFLRSQGTSAIAILNDLKNNAPEIYARL